MKNFACFVHGRDFPGELIGEQGLVGFYTTRIVSAETPEQAEQAALESLRSDEKLQLPAGLDKAKARNAAIFVEEMSEAKDDQEINGFTWYTNDDVTGKAETDEVAR